MGLVGGVVALNAVLTAVGYCVLAAPLRGATARVRASYAGVALLLGTALVFVVLSVAAPLGARTGLLAFGISCALVCGAGLGLRALRSVDVSAHSLAAEPPRSRLEDALMTAAAFALAALLLVAVVGGFRSAAWLDDTWYFWLPKGRALDLVGLDPTLWRFDPRLQVSFGGGGEILTFIRPDNPLWWSILLNTVMRFVGSIDLRAVNAEMAFLLVGFTGAAARLLWGRVRTVVLLPALLVLVSAPELLRQAQGGAADVPLAFFAALAVLGAAGWLVERDAFALLLVFAFAAAALAIKTEGLVEVVVFLAIISVAGWRARRALVPLWLVAAAAFATLVPWLAWRSWHDVASVFSLRQALSPRYLADRTDVLRGASETIGGHFTSVREWSIVVLAVVVLSAGAALRERRLVWLTPALFLAAGYALFVWVSWADPEAEFRLVASAYRYVTGPILVAGVFLPVLADRLVNRTGSASANAAKT